MFFCEFCEICKNTFFTEPVWTTASIFTSLLNALMNVILKFYFDFRKHQLEWKTGIKSQNFQWTIPRKSLSFCLKWLSILFCLNESFCILKTESKIMFYTSRVVSLQRLAIIFQLCIQNPVKHLRCSILMFQKQLHGGVL